MCEGDRLGDVQLDKCKKFAPTNLVYAEPEYRIYVNAQASGVKPSVYGLVDGYDIQPHLPEGLSIDQKTGEIVGTPTEEKPSETYTVTAYNDMGSATASFKLRIVIGWCEPDEKFDRTPIGETATYDCAVEGSSGTLRRTCRMGKNEPEWGMTIGVCPVASKRIRVTSSLTSSLKALAAASSSSLAKPAAASVFARK